MSRGWVEESPLSAGQTWLEFSLWNKDLGLGLRSAGDLPLEGAYHSTCLGTRGRGSPVFLSTWTQKWSFCESELGVQSEGREQVVPQVPQNLSVVTEIYYIFFNKCFFTCCMPFAQFPETLSDCCIYNFYQLWMFHWILNLQNSPLLSFCISDIFILKFYIIHFQINL